MTALVESNKQVTIFPNDADWKKMIESSEMLVQSGMLPKDINSRGKAMAIMMKGHELGIPPMQAFSQISVIQGKPTISPELMLALIMRRFPETVIDYEQLDNEGCVMIVTRAPSKPQKFSFTMQDAINARLTNKDNWKKYARAMLRSRCVAEMARSIFPDVIMGASYTAEELNVNTDENCQPIDVTPANNNPPANAQPAATAETINAEFEKSEDPDETPKDDGEPKLSDLAFKIIQAFIPQKISRYQLEDYLMCSAMAWEDEHIKKARELFAKCKAGEITSESLSKSLYKDKEKDEAIDAEIAGDNAEPTNDTDVLGDLNSDFASN